MSSREAILGAIRVIEMDAIPMPLLPVFDIWFDDPVAKFKEVVTTIGAQVYEVDGMQGVLPSIQQHFELAGRIISTLPQLAPIAAVISKEVIPQSLEDVELAIIKGDFGVAENGAIWLPETLMGQRVLPFICQRLIIVIERSEILPLMSQAYERIGTADYAYGTFLAGPSKTADIEQSLVLGAHGARSLGVILI